MPWLPQQPAPLQPGSPPAAAKVCLALSRPSQPLSQCLPRCLLIISTGGEEAAKSWLLDSNSKMEGKTAKSAVKVTKAAAEPVAEDGGRRSGRTQRKVYSEPNEDDPFEEAE